MSVKYKVLKEDLIYPELSFKLVGYAFEVFKKLGYGHREDVYQKAYAEMLKTNNHNFVEQQYCPVVFNDKVIKKLFLDFKVDEKLIVELKKDEKFSPDHIEQVNQYLKSSGLQLAILFNFGRQGVLYKRLVNTLKK